MATLFAFILQEEPPIDVVIYEMRIELSTIFDFTGSSESSYSAQYGAEEDL